MGSWPGSSLVSELNHRTPSWCLDSSGELVGVENTPTCWVSEAFCGKRKQGFSLVEMP